MNTRLFFISAAAILLAACAQIENPAENKVPVSLTYSTVSATETKAAQDLNEGTFGSGESVTVRISNTGANVWENYTFTTGDAGAMTAPDPAPYYPAGAQNIDIVAYYPASAGTSFTVASDQTADAGYKASDLMFASVPNQEKQAAAVELAFSHKMAKLNVNITPGQGVSSINSLSVLNVKPTVSFDQSTGEVGVATGSATTIAMSNNGSVIIPAQTINGELLSIVTDKGTATYSVASKEFEVGKFYTLNITVNLRAIGATNTIHWDADAGSCTVQPTVPVGREAVDLGLSVKWANMNVGASSITDYGLFFAWGETVGYSSDPVNYRYDNRTFDRTSYKYFTRTDPTDYYSDGTYDSSIYNSDGVLKAWTGATYDAARVNWGGTWRMPTQAECKELLDTRYYPESYEWAWQTDYLGSGHNGFLVTCLANNNSIFLPAAGMRSGNDFGGAGSYGYYWSSSVVTEDTSQAYNLPLSSGSYYMANFYRYVGYSIRPVTD